MITLDSFSHKIAAEKYRNVKPVSPEDLYGNWEIIASYFTIVDDNLKTTFQLEGRKYDIKQNGQLIMDNTTFGFGKRDRTWKLESNNTVFHEGLESYHVRVYRDTMEWIEQSDSDYVYFVLVKR